MRRSVVRLAIGILTVMAMVAAPASANGRSDRAPDTSQGVSLPPGYFMEALTTGLDFPTGLATDGDTIWVSEAGIVGTTPQVVEIEPDGTAKAILSPADVPEQMLKPPFIDVTYHDGWLWLTHRQPGVNGWVLGAISRFRPDEPAATFETVLADLPTAGDHHTNEIVFGPDGRAYFSQGTATNSSVVGLDNLRLTGWLDQFPDFHDFPAKDIELSGVEFVTPNPLTDDPDDEAITPPFLPFDFGRVEEGHRVEGAPKNGITIGNGTVYSFDPGAADVAASLRLEAWGLRNPFGVGIDPFDPDTLFASNNGADIRTAFSGDRSNIGGNPDPDNVEVLGSRPLANEHDDLFRITIGGDDEFFGWPDYFHDPDTGEVLPVTDPLFCDDSLLQPDCEHDFALEQGFRESLDVLPAFAQFGVHSSANKFDFSLERRFGHRGDLFVAETGAFVPITGANQFAGYRVVRVDRDSGEVSDFIVNTGDTVDEVLAPESFNKPIDVKFRGETMMVLDFGVFEPAAKLAKPDTGKIWLVSRGRGPLMRR